MRLIKVLFLTTVLVLSLSAREKVNVNFSDLEVNDFIKLISKITNKNILINNRVTGTVNLVSTSPIYDDELMDILVAVLESKGFTLMQVGSLLEVVRSADAAKHNAKVATKGKKLKGSFMVTQALELSSENVDIVASKIRYLVSKTAKLMTMKESNTILITDYPKNIETIKKVIKDIDTNNQFIVKIIPIEKAEAKKIQLKLVDISKSLFNEKVESQKVKIILDDNINGIIVVGLEKNVDTIEGLVKKLDIESNINKSVKIFSLKNSDAKSVLASVNEIISKQTYPDPALKPNISVSEEINAIIAVGEPSIIKGIKLIIDTLDKEKYQVYVQARIINIYKKSAEELGVKYGFDGATISSNGGLYSLATNFGGVSISPLAKDLVSLPSNLTSGFALGAAIDFLQVKGASKSISNPSILCVNNKESSIYVGQTISISSGSTTGTAGTTASFKREDVGLKLKIKPRVSSTDKVTLEVETILENVDSYGNTDTGEQPVTSKQEVKTQAILRHGESIIIGGLIKDIETNDKTKVPLLGDIPWLGKLLFSSNAMKKEKTSLVVMLTPYVIDKSDKLSQLQKDLGVLANLQKEYNDKVFKKIEEKGMIKSEDSNSLNDKNIEEDE